MRTVAHTAARWRKSSRSNDDGACVEVEGTLRALRDSKDPAGQVLEFGDRCALTALMRSVRG